MGSIKWHTSGIIVSLAMCITSGDWTFSTTSRLPVHCPAGICHCIKCDIHDLSPITEYSSGQFRNALHHSFCASDKKACNLSKFFLISAISFFLPQSGATTGGRPFGIFCLPLVSTSKISKLSSPSWGSQIASVLQFLYDTRTLPSILSILYEHERIISQ